MRPDIHEEGRSSPITDDVQQAISKLFTKPERVAVLAALKRIRPDRDVARVHLAILARSFGSVREVERLVEMANEDHRQDPIIGNLTPRPRSHRSQGQQ
jgi:hypothetical protein